MARRGDRWAQDERQLPFHGGALTLLAALALCRGLGDGAALLMFGASLFAATLVPPGLRSCAARRARWIARGAAPVAAVAMLLRLPLQAAIMGDGWGDAVHLETLHTVLADSAVGRAWAVQMGVALLAVAAAVSGATRAQALSSGLALASLALSGHAAGAPGLAGWAIRGTLALHVLAGGAWVGSLPDVLRLMTTLAQGAADGDEARALKRFSAVGHGVVALVIATGALDTALIAGLSGALPLSAYGVVVAAKLLLAGAMATLAAVNRYRIVPVLPRDPRAGRALIGNTRMVLWLGCGAVAASGLLGLLDPPE